VPRPTAQPARNFSNFKFHCFTVGPPEIFRQLDTNQGSEKQRKQRGVLWRARVRFYQSSRQFQLGKAAGKIQETETAGGHDLEDEAPGDERLHRHAEDRAQRSSEASAGKRTLASDGKALKGSFDAFNDVKARQMLNA
jgi:hypothetical protein